MTGDCDKQAKFAKNRIGADFRKTGLIAGPGQGEQMFPPVNGVALV